ncbi:hypothetical protein ACFX15_012217 [Malus domestica]
MVRSATTYSLLFINRAQSCKSDVKPPDLGVDTLIEALRSKTTVVRRERKDPQQLKRAATAAYDYKNDPR